MLTLILGTDWVANRDEILRLAAEDVCCERPNRVLMVPELISHDMERRLCAAAGDTASRYAEVLSFTRLANRVCGSVGAAAMECLDDGGRVVAMASAARQLKNVLKTYASVETRPEFLSSMVNAVDEFKRCCISSKDLLKASKQTGGALAQKLEELALLLEAYDGVCSRGKRDPRDQMTWLLEQLHESDYAQNHVFYIDGFPDFTRQNYAIIEHLIQESPSVTVSLNCDQSASKWMAFEKAGATAADLIRSAKKLNVPVQIRYMQAKMCSTSSILPALFQGSLVACSAVESYPASSVHAECMAAAAKILTLVKNGCRYRQISVVCTDISAYQNILQFVFRRSGIPVYQSGKEEILSKTVIHTVLSAIEAAVSGFDRQEVVQYLKSALSPLDAEVCDHLENYVITWNIQGNRWLESWEYHPDGLGARWTEETERELALINEAREQAIQPLQMLRKGIRNAETLADQVIALSEFLENIALAQRLELLANEMEQQGDLRNAQILNQLWEILLGAIEQLHDVLGNTVWDTETFVKLLTLLLRQYDVGTIPPVLDAVSFGPVSSMRCQQAEHLILLGAREGLLPSYSGSEGVLSDQEREALRDLGVPLTGGGMEGLQAEFSEIYGVFCGARTSVTISYSGGQPSFIYRRLAEMAGEERKEAVGNEILNPSDAAVYLSRFGSEAIADQWNVGDTYRDIMTRRAYTLGKLECDTVQKLYGRQLRLSASQTDKLAECRFAYFLRYGLCAKERKEAQVDPAEFGTYVHAVLEKTARRVMECGGFHRVSLEQTVMIAREYSDTYIKERFDQLDSQRMRYLLQRNFYELNFVIAELWQELSVSQFLPVGFEIAFGDGAQMPAIPIPNTAMPAVLRGFVDRIDAWSAEEGKFFRVVDYKTGQKDFDYCDIFNGIGLQMLLYLFALAQNGEQLFGSSATAAGVQYFPARSPMISANGKLSPEEAEEIRLKNCKRKGLILSEERVVDAMEPGGAIQRLSCKRGKNGELTGDIADREQFAQLRTYILNVLAKLVDQVASGVVEPNPYTRGSSYSACMYCPYQEVCHFASVEGRRNYKAMPKEEFWERIGKELHHG